MFGKLFGWGREKTHHGPEATGGGTSQHSDVLEQTILAADQAAEKISKPASDEIDLFAAPDDDAAWGEPTPYDNMLDGGKKSIADLVTNALATDSSLPDRHVDRIIEATENTVDSIPKTDHLRAAHGELKEAKIKKDAQRIQELEQEISSLSRDRARAQTAYRASNKEFWEDVDNQRGRPGGAYDQLRAHAELADDERATRERMAEDSAAKLRAIHGYRASAKLPQPAKLPWGQRVKNWFSRK